MILKRTENLTVRFITTLNHDTDEEMTSSAQSFMNDLLAET